MTNQQTAVQALRIENFRGIRELTIDMKGQSINVYGQNGANKSTIDNAIKWALFGKDAEMGTLSHIQPLDENNQIIEGLVPEVEIELLVNGVVRKFRRRLNASKTSFWVDDVPQKTLKAYEMKINEIMDEETFKMITSPTYFVNLHWKEQRAKLFELSGEIADETVIASEPELSELPSLLEGKSFADRKAQVDEQTKLLKDKIKAIPAKIDENKRQIPLSPVDTTAEKEKLAALEAEIEASQAQKLKVESGTGLIEIESNLKVLISDAREYANNFLAAYNEKFNQLQTAVQEKQGNVQIVESRVKQLEASISEKQTFVQKSVEQYNQLTAERTQFVERYQALEQEVYVQQEVTTCCPTCDQALQPDKVEAAKQAAFVQWESNRNQQLENIKQSAGHFKPQLESLKQQGQDAHAEIQALEQQLTTANEELEKHQTTLQKANEQLASYQQEKPDILADPQYIEMGKQKAAYEAEIKQLKEHQSTVVSDIIADIQRLKAEKQAIENSLKDIVDVDKLNARISELQVEQRQLNEQLEKYERIDYLIKLFDTTKIKLVEQAINEQFELVKFELFRTQADGKVVETCEVTMDGVNYKALNTAAQVNAGLDIIRTLQRFYGKSAPIVIDNRESITNLIDMDSQIISLIVSPTDKTLRIEHVEGAGVAADGEGVQDSLAI